MLARIKVEDFQEFATGYLLPKHVKMRADGGVIADSIQHLSNDPTVVVVIHDFPDLETAESYTTSAGLFQAMHDDGVTGKAAFEFFEVA